MLDRNRIQTPLILLIVVLVLLALTVLLQYALKHDLPPAPAVRQWAAVLSEEKPTAQKKGAALAGEADEAREEAGEGLLPEATPGPELDGLYYAYLSDTLIPLYGLSDETAVADACAARYRFDAAKAPEGATGILTAAVTDTDGDALTEFIVLYIDGSDERYPLKLRVYAVRDGKVMEPAPDTAETITTLKDNAAAGSAASVEIVSGEDGAFLLFHEYFEATGAACDRYTAFDIAGGKIAPVLRGAFTLYDNPVLLLDVIPPWLDESALKDAPEATDAASGLSGRLLYSDGIADYAYGDSAVTLPAYKELYPSAIDATAAMLGPLSGTERIKLLEPLSLDWTGFRFALTEDAGAAEE